MPKLSNFTINSDYPAIAKVGYNSLSVTMPSRYFAVGDYYTVTAEGDISSGDILSPIIQIGVGGGCFYGNGFLRMSDTWYEEFWVERISPTKVKASYHVMNQGQSGQTFGGQTVIFHLNAFKIP